MNALTLIFAAACIFAIAYRFYGLYLAQKVMNLREDRVTPAEAKRTTMSWTPPAITQPTRIQSAPGM